MAPYSFYNFVLFIGLILKMRWSLKLIYLNRILARRPECVISEKLISYKKILAANVFIPGNCPQWKSL
jgi:hypothetical protein